VTKLTALKILEVSAVGPDAGGPANADQLDGDAGWLVMKSRAGVTSEVPLTPRCLDFEEFITKARQANQTPALAAPPPPGTAAVRGDSLQIVKAENGWAVTTDGAAEIKVYPRGGEPYNVSKVDLAKAETDAIVPGLGFAPEAEIQRRRTDVFADAIEKARQYNRDSRGRFRKWDGTFFRRSDAQAQPQFKGQFFR